MDLHSSATPLRLPKEGETLLSGQLRHDQKLDRITNLLLDLLNKPNPEQQDLGQRLVNVLIIIEKEVTAQRQEREALKKEITALNDRLQSQDKMLAAICTQLGTPLA
ncbi:hypothetical protein [Paracoccus jeotgali]|uniref:Uncharacterized protein n=1 Tax=Paracoccus jeotgali TaxID=2065379 RepID=A0A2K9MJS0_9RHOB|nr:hypothetical protein [Paracoccus jeotgali]AUM75877.1 hypothetical protein CYR75_15775 [Paracoccus jeotgali]